MKALSIAVVTVGLACGAFGQGWFELDNSGLTHGVVDQLGSRYSGVFGLEVWSLNTADPGPDLVDVLNWVGAGDYALLGVNGFNIEATYNGQMTNGILRLGACRMPDVTPRGSTVTVALVAWKGSAPGFEAFLRSEVTGLAGIIAFRQPTTEYTLASQPNPSPMTWSVNEDLALWGIPERPPTIGQQPQDATSMVGGTASFTVVVGSLWGFRYRWLFNGKELSPTASIQEVYTNSNFPQLTTYYLILPSLQLTNAGQYSFVATNFAEDPFGSVASSNAVLTVLPQPSLSISNAAQGVTVSWPIWATNYAIQEADGLAAPITWLNLPFKPVVSTNDIRVTLQPTASHKFYRLQRQ
jgi:hypothetical protein